MGLRVRRNWARARQAGEPGMRVRAGLAGTCRYQGGACLGPAASGSGRVNPMATAQSLSSGERYFQTEHLDEVEGDEPQAQEQQHEDGDRLAAGAQHGAPLFDLALPPLIVMPLDGEEHARAEHEALEGNEDYRDPIDHFEYFQLFPAIT